MVEQQAVFAAPGEFVQGKAYAPQKILCGLQALQFGFGEEAMVDQFVQCFGAEVALGYPGDGLDVTQTAGAGLDVGFEVVGGVVVTVVTLLLLAHFCCVEIG